jgi:uncharacterized protein (DUF1697 family)
MSTYIALFRGINVGGAGILPMKELVAILESLGCTGVQTYIQSGNAVFQSTQRSSAKLASEVTAAVMKQRKFAPAVMLLTAKELEKVMNANPFPNADDLTRLGAGFLEAIPKQPDLAALELLRATSEQFALVGKCFYLHAPDGFGKSKLAARAEKLIGVPMTMRNWRTVDKIKEMAETY